METKHLLLNAKNCMHQTVVKVHVCITYYSSDCFDDEYKDGTYFAVEGFLNHCDNGAGTANTNYQIKDIVWEDPRKSGLLSEIKTLKFHFYYEGHNYSCSFRSIQDSDYESVRIGNGNLIKRIDANSFIDLRFEY